MAKTVVTHFSPDFDAVGAVWILKRFHPDFAEARIVFVPTGERLADQEVEQEEVVHVDTGGGPFDHHETDKYTCATKLVWQSVKKERKLKNPAVERIVNLVTDIDHARDLNWPEAIDDRYELGLPHILDGWKLAFPGQDQRLLEWGLIYLDGLYQTLKAKIAAQKTIEKRGKEFQTRWGKGLAVESGNDKILEVAEKLGFAVVVKKDLRDGAVRIYGRADKGVNLRRAYQKFLKADPNATWYLHPSKRLLLNGSRKKPGMRPSTLTLAEVIKVIAKT